MPNPRVKLLEYDSRWPGMFAEERGHIATALNAYSPIIEHFGSTSVPQLKSKGTVDILVMIADMNDAPACINALSNIGYRYSNVSEADTPTRRLLYKESGSSRTFQVHLIATNDPLRVRFLAFRDKLRANPALRGQYEALKHQLVAQHGHDVPRYSREKSPFVMSVVSPTPPPQVQT